ncbi:MAG: hypothetical protein PHS44_00870 [Candidatus Dojkabacteria bacterium]|nr:hypothetical protein [Candidatus Dojkabacteria bacterium]
MTAYFALLLCSDDFERIREIDEIVYGCRSVKKVFGRSPKRTSSFYPKIHFLTSRDVRNFLFDKLRAEWLDLKQTYRERTFSFVISDCKLVNKGLLFLTMRAPKEAKMLRMSLSEMINKYRTGEVEEGRAGDKYWDSFPHLSIGSDISSEESHRIKRDLVQKGVIGSELVFSDPVLYSRSSDWDKESELRYY